MKLALKHMILLALILTNMSSDAAIWRVNPNPLSGAQFAGIQDAVNSPLVFDGDEIHIESNAEAVAADFLPYSATINKSLILRGPGYFLAENFGDFEDMDAALVNVLQFVNGSQGSVVSGLTIASLNIGANDITVRQCSIQSTEFNNVIGGTLFSNYMQGVDLGIPVLSIVDATNIYVAHCFILHNNEFPPGQNAVLESGFSIANEYNHCIVGNANSQIFGGSVHNCIFKAHTFNDIQGTNFSNNIFELGFEPVSSFNPLGAPNDPSPITDSQTNQLNVELTTVFDFTAAGGSLEGQYNIATGSVADGTSDDVPPDNIGVFTVTIDGYKPSGLGASPVLVDLNASAYSDTYLLPVTYSAFSDGSAPIVQAEFYFDNDPGFGLALPISVEATLNISNGFFTADISGLSDAVHTLGLRVLDAEGEWSLTEFDEFEKIGIAPLPNLSLMSYEFNDESQFFAPIDLDNPNDEDTDGIFVETYDLSGLPEGIHTLRFRATDAFGFQGITYTTTLLVLPDVVPAPHLTQIEYFLDIDPGFGQAQQIPIQAGIDLFDDQVDFIFDDPALGPHNLWVRFKDADGNWSVAYVEKIHIVDEVFEALDSDNDCDIDIIDLLTLLSAFGCSEDPLDNTSSCALDANGDGSVNTPDVLLFLGIYGATCDSQFPGGPDLQNPDESNMTDQ